jgi:hypothetical protein
MSWLYSQALVEASSADISLDGVPCALWSGTPTPQASWLPDKTREPLRLSRSGMTCRPLTADPGEAVLTWCLEASLARTSAPPAKAQALTEKPPECGVTWRELSARFDRDTSLWRTHRCLWDEALPESSVTLPRWGMMRGGVCSERPTPELHISGTASGLSLPTPTASDTRSWINRSKSAGAALRPTLGAMAKHNMWPTPQSRDWKGPPGAGCQARGGHQSSLPAAVKLWPTPTAHNAKETNAPSEAMRHTPTLTSQVGGHLNPTWVEWLMGWPLGWTALDALETDRYQLWLRSHGGC